MTSAKLTPRRRQILDYLINTTTEQGYPPSLREIAAAVRLKSPSTVLFHLRALEEAGYIRREPHRNRALAPLASGADHKPQPRYVPLVGRIAAGEPILASENIETMLPLPATMFSAQNLFMLEVTGDSMIEAGILDGDIVIVTQQPVAEPGDIVVALLDDEATVKYFYPRAEAVELRPANPYMDSIISDEVQIIGRVVGIVRSLK